MHCVACVLENVDRRWLNVDDKGLQLWCPQRLYRLVVGTQQAHTACINDAAHTLRRGSVQLSFVFAVLDELARLDVLLHFLAGNEQVLTAGDLAWPNVAGGVWRSDFNNSICDLPTNTQFTHMERDYDTFRDPSRSIVVSAHCDQLLGHRSGSTADKSPAWDTAWLPPHTWRSSPDQSRRFLSSHT